MCVCVYRSTRMWRSEVNVRCLLPSTSYLTFVSQGFSVNLNLLVFAWPVSPEEFSVSTFSVLRLEIHAKHTAFYWGAGDQSHVLMLAGKHCRWATWMLFCTVTVLATCTIVTMGHTGLLTIWDAKFPWGKVGSSWWRMDNEAKAMKTLYNLQKLCGCGWCFRE